MFCPNCGTQLEDGAAFCSGCGTKIEAPKASSNALVSFNIGKVKFEIVKEKIDFIALVAAIVAFISLFLPYVGVSVKAFGEKYSETAGMFEVSKGNAIFLLIAILAFIVIDVFGFQFIAKIVGYVPFAFMLISVLSLAHDLKEAKEELGGFSDYVKTYPAVGFWFLIISTAVIAFSWAIKSKLIPLIKSKTAAKPAASSAE